MNTHADTLADRMHTEAAARVAVPGFDPDHAHFTAMADHVARAWRGVFFDGPQSDQNHEGDEIPVWLVYIGDTEAEPTSTVYRCHDFTAAEQLARQMARDRHLELIHEASHA